MVSYIFGTRHTVLTTLFLVSIYLLPTKLLAAEYYVDATTGDDVCCGTESQPWKTLSRVNSGPTGNNDDYNAGDRILLKRGDVWREELIPPNSGADGAAIVFGAYPNDPGLPRPVISCTLDVTNLLWEGIIGNGGFDDDSPASGDVIRGLIRKYYGWLVSGTSQVAQIETVDGDNAFRLLNASVRTHKFHLQDGVSYRIEGSFKKETPDANIKITMNSGTYYLNEGGVLLERRPAGSSSDQRTNFFPKSLPTQSLGNGWVRFSLDFTGVNEGEYEIAVAATSGTLFLDDLKLIDTEENYWTVNAHNVTNARIFIEDGSRLASGAEWDNTKKWHGFGNEHLLYRYIKDPSQPANSLELSDRRVGILIQGQDYIQIEDITVSGCERQLIDRSTEGAGILLSDGASHNTIDNVRVENSAEGITVVGLGPNNELNEFNQIINTEVMHGISQGIALRNHAANNLIGTSTVKGLAELESDYFTGSDGTHQDIEGISLGGGTGGLANNTVEHCHVSDLGPLSTGSTAITAFNAESTIVRYNRVENIGGTGIQVAANSSNSEIYYNTVRGTGTSELAKRGAGIAVISDISSQLDGVKIYNNTVTDCSNMLTWGAIALSGSSTNSDSLTNIEVKNNILEACRVKPDPILGIITAPIAFYSLYIDWNSLDSDHNLIFRDPLEQGTLVSFKDILGTGSWSSFTEYQSQTMFPPQDQNSQTGDPLFVDRLVGDLRLTSSLSPAFDHGINVGLLNDFNGSPIVGTPDIGAFEFHPDTDGDGVTDDLDNCPQDANPNQTDEDINGVGNVCDPIQETLISIAAEDGWVRESSAGSGVGGKSNSTGTGGAAVRIGDHKNNRQYKSILSFNTSGIPADSAIQGATLELTFKKNVGNDEPYATFGPAWVDLATDGFGGNAALQNSDFEAVADVPQTAQLISGATATADLDAVGLAGIATASKVQLRVAFSQATNSDSTNDSAGYYSSDNGTGSRHPRLVVDYTLPD